MGISAPTVRLPERSTTTTTSVEISEVTRRIESVPPKSHFDALRCPDGFGQEPEGKGRLVVRPERRGTPVQAPVS